MCKFYIFLLPTLVLGLECVNIRAIDEADGSPTRSFDVDHANNEFLLDGVPFRYISGSFQYFRTPRQYWRDRLRKMRAAGLNAVSTYVEWSLHQPEANTWRWTGEADVVEFINIAREEDLLVILRPGPYICAERNMGGLPPWLMTLVPDIKMRTNDTRYMRHVEVYLGELLTRVESLLRGNGGPIIMVQVENEYGSFHACDVAYRESLRDIMKKHIGNKALLYTTDGSSASALRCGTVSGAYATVDFGTSSNASANFAVMRQFQATGPLVNSEFYSGWLTHWEEPFARVKTADVVKVLDEMLALGASVNIYMFYGGTNFGFASGANGPRNYSPQITSYDYDAPLTEAGDPTEKYWQIRRVVSKYLPLPNISLPIVAPKGNYGSVSLRPVIKLFDPSARRAFGSIDGHYAEPPTFQQLGIAHHLVLYETVLPYSGSNSSRLFARAMDRALVYVDSRHVGTTSRSHEIYTIPLVDSDGKSLRILVENQGHLNFGTVIEDWKGLIRATLDDSTLSSWNVTAFKLDTVEPLKLLDDSDGPVTSGNLSESPLFLRGYFNIDGKPLDTYLDTSRWCKGVAYVNGHNLGRYWPSVGPQITLYVPSAFLKNGINELIVLELECLPSPTSMTFRDTADLG